MASLRGVGTLHSEVAPPVPRGPRLPCGPGPAGRSAALTAGRRLEGRPTPCATGPEDLWFAASPGDVEAAKALCRPCRLREPCLEGAVARAEPWGVWGGERWRRARSSRARGRVDVRRAARWGEPEPLDDGDGGRHARMPG